MEIKIRINLDNDEFVHECHMDKKCGQKFNPVPVSHLLGRIGLELLDVGRQTYGIRSIRDINGNTVGTWELSDE